jgi:phage tail sheath protein FI
MRPCSISPAALVTGLIVLIFAPINANAGQGQSPPPIVVAQAEDLPRNIEMKPGAAKAIEDEASGDKTRQIITESKDADGDETESADTAGDAADKAKAGDAAATSEAADAAKTEAEPKTDAKPETAAEAPASDAEALDPAALALAVQTELKRVGCYFSSLDGLWGRRSQQALAAFGHFGKAEIGDLSPTAEVLTTIRGRDGLVCKVGAVEEPAPRPRRRHGGGY